MPPRVSVIMNCYNGERFLAEALDSVMHQTMCDWELVFWDNCSTDSSSEIVKSYGNRVKYFRSPVNETLGAARNHAVQQAAGTYIAFLDTDDVWLPDTLSKLVEVIERDGTALVYAGVFEMNRDGRNIRTVLPIHPSGFLFPSLLRQFDINVPTTLLRREALLSSGLRFDPMIQASEEYCLFMQLAATGCRFSTVMEPLARYRVHAGSLTSAAIERWAFERTYTLDRIEATWPGLCKEYPTEFREARARAVYYRARWLMARGERAKAVKELSSVISVGPIYLALFLLAAMSSTLWRWAIIRRTGRADVA